MRTNLTEINSIELEDNPPMDRMTKWFRPQTGYQQVDGSERQQHGGAEDEEHSNDGDSSSITEPEEVEAAFSWIEYTVFLLLGIAMLWAWNMFLAAAPYFQGRFENDRWIVNHFQPAEISVSTVANLGTMLILGELQKNASYPQRIIVSLLISTAVFVLLTLSTIVKTSATTYFGFLLVTVFAASVSTGFIQNGTFAFASGFGQSAYTQAIMTGQGIAGVLPPLVQIISVAVVNAKRPHDVETVSQSPKSAFIYFLTAVGVAIITLAAFTFLLHRRQTHSPLLTSVNKIDSHDSYEENTLANSTTSLASREKPTVSLLALFRKLPFFSTAVVLCFAITMVFPVFTSSIQSTSNISSSLFIPLAFLLWNIGDLLGRLITIFPRISLTHFPFALFCLAMARLLFIPLYFLCNIKGRGAVVKSDVFYLVVVQFGFGLSNGYLGSQCMMGAGDWVLPHEREATGAFMGLMLVAGLTVGSLLSFLLGDI